MQTSCSGDFETGYLAGLVDGEGYIRMRYNKDSNRSYPNLIVYCTSKPIIDEASRIMNVKSCPRREHGKLVGWLAVSTGKKALDAMRRIEPHLSDSSKKCRVLTCLRSFQDRVGIEGRHPSSRFFAHCPPPGKLGAKIQSQPASNAASGARRLSDARLSEKWAAIPNENIPAETSALSAGWLCGIIDGEGYIHIRYRSDRDSTILA